MGDKTWQNKYYEGSGSCLNLLFNFMKLTLDNLFKTLSLNSPEIPFEVEFWDGTKERYGSGIKKFKLVLKNKEVIKRILGAGSIGFGEEFMKGNVLIKGDIQEFLKMANSKIVALLKISLKTKLKIFLNYIFSLGYLSQSKKNISYHYDLSSDFYSLWLDDTLTYSCAYFRKEDDSLNQAQLQKYDYICKKLQLKKGENLIDVGCGWGGMMFYALQNYGVRCEGYTLSKKQYDYVDNNIKKRNLSHLLKVYLKDYREIHGKFDKFVSIGMFEHIGKKFYPIFFDIVKKSLKPKGIGLIQTIGSSKDKPTDPWITKYIFPGGLIPALQVVIKIMNQKNLVFFDIEDLRMHYAKTLDKWIENLEGNIDKIKSVMIKSLNSVEKTEQFIRMWQLYLNGSSVSFKNGNNRLYQITFSNGLKNQLPLTRNYIYGV